MITIIMKRERADERAQRFASAASFVSGALRIT
jgi:hypothetical protein